jgi:hypothetical protein
MKEFEIEKMYATAKMDQEYIKDLCENQDSRAFAYVMQCSKHIRDFKSKYFERILQIAKDYKNRFEETNDPNCFNGLLHDANDTYNIFFDDAMSSLKEMYIND